MARLVPIDSGDDVSITPPQPGAALLADVKLPVAAKIATDVVELLLDDRRKRG